MKHEYERFTGKQKILIAVAAVLVVLLAAISFVLIHYRVTKVKVTGNKHYSEQEIKDMILEGGVKDNSLLLSAKYRNKSIKNIPFVESMDVEVTGADSIEIHVYEKSLAGCVSYLGSYMYFDREGIVVESSPQGTEGVPEITGLAFDHVTLYEKLPVKDSGVFKEILNLTQILTKYDIMAQKIYFDASMKVTLYFGQARIKIGGGKNIDEKIMQLSTIVPKLEGKSGVLDMTEFGENTNTLAFEPD